MNKTGYFDDTFEKAPELDQPITKPSEKRDAGIEQLEKGKAKKQNHTPLDTKKLQDKYQDQDKKKAEALRQRLFQLVKSGEEKAIKERRKKELERQRQTLAEQEQKKKRGEEEKKKQQEAPIPKGKVRRSIFSPKTFAKRLQTEVRPSSGKQ